jgi:hypothetical protein
MIISPAMFDGEEKARARTSKLTEKSSVHDRAANH